jgi:hypothetical protein
MSVYFYKTTKDFLFFQVSVFELTHLKFRFFTPISSFGVGRRGYFSNP